MKTVETNGLERSVGYMAAAFTGMLPLPELDPYKVPGIRPTGRAATDDRLFADWAWTLMEAARPVALAAGVPEPWEEVLAARALPSPGKRGYGVFLGFRKLGHTRSRAYADPALEGKALLDDRLAGVAFQMELTQDRLRNEVRVVRRHGRSEGAFRAFGKRWEKGSWASDSGTAASDSAARFAALWRTLAALGLDPP